MRRNWSPHILLARLSNGAATSENNLQFLRRLNIELPMIGNFTPRNVLKRIENGYSGKNLCMYLHIAFFLRA